VRDILKIDVRYSTFVPFRYLLFHKPFNVLSQFTQGLTAPASGERRSTLADFIKEPGVYPVGRLDYDSEGLMLLTDDGALQHRLSNPRFAHPRTYWVQVEGCVTESALQQLSSGVTIGDYRTRPAEARAIAEPALHPRVPPIRVRKSIPTSWIELTITEGRNRQVRRMTAAVGFPTLRLIRVAIGALQLSGLVPGQWRPLSAAELKLLQKLPT
jgi:23S rRNA pseudouridine2457 synthase